MKADIESFRQAVYAIVASIPPGKVMSYGQADRLHAEGVLFRPNGCVDLKRCGWDLNTEVGNPD